MPFDFFNSSYLAFGSKITKAFITLARLADDMDENTRYLSNQLADYDMQDANYRVNKPTSPTKATRGEQIFGVLKTRPIIIKEISLNDVGGIIVKINYFTNNKITIGTGNSGILKWGYAVINKSNSNNAIERDITFTQENPILSNVLFKFRVENGRINISNLNKNFPISPSNYDTHYVNMSLTQVDNGIEATGYETYITVSTLGTGYKSTETDGKITEMVECYGTNCNFNLTGVSYTYGGEKVENKTGDTVYRIDYTSSRRTS